MIERLPFTDFFQQTSVRHRSCFLAVWLCMLSPVPAGYKARPYIPLPVESYPSKQTSEGVTIAVDPMFTDALAAKAFDKKDIVARGIMPLAVIIFNSNQFAVEVEAPPIELLHGKDRIRPVSPEEAIGRIFPPKPSRQIRIPGPVPLPRITISDSNADAVADFKNKYLGIKRIEADSSAAGFVYLPVNNVTGLRSDLAEARVYVPNLFRLDNGSPLIFFEIDLKPAVDAAAKK